ncbi:MAG: CBS domain-containing protein [Candidatus Latescibacterota bacterium]|nr:MAG: CBS domain-containing protein [Candidatus Latescibacterota bacterium]
MRVRDIMSAPVFAVSHVDTLKDVEKVMEWRHVRHVPVVDDQDELVGLITHRDLLQACVSSIAEISQREQDALLRAIPVAEIMKDAVLTVSPDENARDAAALMLDRKIGCLPVVEERRLVGILTEADFVRYLLEILQ